MIYSGSGYEFRIRILPLVTLPMLFKHIRKFKKTKTLLSLKRKIYHYLSFLFHTTVQSYRNYSPKSTGLKKIPVYVLNFSALSFLLDPEQIIPDPDPGKSSGSDRIHNTVFIWPNNVDMEPALMPNPNSMYLDPQRWKKCRILNGFGQDLFRIRYGTSIRNLECTCNGECTTGT